MPGCAWDVRETAADVESVVLAYAKDRHGELPEPIMLGPLRAERVAAAVATHLATHPADDESRWLARFLPSDPRRPCA